MTEPTKAETALEDILRLLPLLSRAEYGKLKHIVSTRPWWAFHPIDESQVGTDVVNEKLERTKPKKEPEGRSR